MRWSDRQQAMLREMGLRLWLPAEPASELAAAPTAEPSMSMPAAGPAPDTSLAAARAAAGTASPAAAVAELAAEPAAKPAAKPAALKAPALASPVARLPPQPPGAGSTGSAAAAMDWPALRDAVAGCQACGLCAGRQQTVFGVGHLHARLMVIGEAPGAQEDQGGEPFVGAAGHLLNRMLAALGLGREPALAERQVFITNALKCRPPRHRKPSAADFAACQPFLLRQVALVQPRVILALGHVAAQALLGSDAPLGRLRGQVHRWQGVPLVVSYDPAYLLRQGADKARAWDDLCLTAQLLEAS